MRQNKRKDNELRKVSIKKGFLKYAAGSCLIEMGNTKVICSASVDKKVPFFAKSVGKGWVTAEYGMVPGSCTGRISREASRGKQSGRTQEIQRLIGRSIRAVVDLEKVGERTIWLDADVIQGDGGTRTAAITGCYVALKQVTEKLIKTGELKEDPVFGEVAAVSVGVVDGKPVLDLCYDEDFKAEVDMNIVMTGEGKFIEVQGTAEKQAFSEEDLSKLLTLGKKGIKELIELQKKAIGK